MGVDRKTVDSPKEFRCQLTVLIITTVVLPDGVGARSAQ